MAEKTAMNKTPIRTGVALLVVIALAGCAAQRTDQRAAAERMCDRGEAMTCEEFAGELRNCFCADRAALNRLFEMHSTY